MHNALPLSGHRFRARTTATCSAVALLICISATPAAPAFAQTRPVNAPSDDARAVDPYARFIAEAAHRFGIPERWIRVVMRAESGGDTQAISHKGAIGLMQLMPATWAEMRNAYGFGPDPYDPRDNILAGAAYLRAMHDRFGAPGFLAAYNAGPTRYLAYLSTGRQLPVETRYYLAHLSPLLGVEHASVQQAESAPDPLAWSRSPIFVERSKAPRSASALTDPREGDIATTKSEGIFVRH